MKLIYSEKAKNFCKISTILLSYAVPVKIKVEISQNVVAFSECMNFTPRGRLVSKDGKMWIIMIHSDLIKGEITTKICKKN